MALPAILAGVGVAKSLFDYFHGKREDKKAVNNARQQFDEYYNSPGQALIRAYLRDYWNKHNLQERAVALGQPALLENLLRVPQWNDRMAQQYRAPGGHFGGLANGLVTTLAQYYANTHPPEPR
jgi:hypothetical protein